MSEIFEAVMLICFGVSWPFSVIKSYRSRKTGGKSLTFLILIFTGYVSGLIGKIIFNPSIVILVYACNTFFVGLDLILYFRNKRIEQQVTAEQPI